MRRKKKKQEKKKADRLEEKTAGNGAGLTRLMQDRCGGKSRQGNRASCRDATKTQKSTSKEDRDYRTMSV